MDLTTRKVEITSQNHGFAVDADSLKGAVEVTHVNLNDNTVEGLVHRDLPIFSVQYHPEASPGPHDAKYLFKRFIELMAKHEAPGRSSSSISDARNAPELIRSPNPCSISEGVQIHAQAHRHSIDSSHRRRADYYRPSVRVRLFRDTGAQSVKEEGYRVILVNSNPATIMTDPGFAHRTYIEPITTDIVEKIIAKERPDALLPTLGGQTALNLAIDLAEKGILARYGVEMIGAKMESIKKAEDRDLFKEAMRRSVWICRAAATRAACAMPCAFRSGSIFQSSSAPRARSAAAAAVLPLARRSSKR